MTTVSQAASAQQPSPPNDSSSSSPLSWEGDKMFNIYIYDYCYKRGFRKTARELLQEAEIPPESTPPINAKQGLLFEWWSVFWVLFTAKASGTGSDDALLYTQHQQTQLANRQNAQRLQQPGGPPMNQLPTTPMPQPQTQPQPTMGRMINGMPRAPNYLPNGTMANGVGNTAMQQGAMASAAPSGFSMNGPSPTQSNGVVGPPAPSNTQGGPLPNQNLFPNQRPMTGPQRTPNGVPPFQSPTMGHSPQNSGTAPGQQSMQQAPQPHQQQQQPPQAPMGQLGPSTPGIQPMNRGMLPPQGGPPGMNQMMVSGGQHPGGTPTQTFQQVGRPPSRTATPGQSGQMMHQSPSMGNRQPPGSGGMVSQEQLNAEFQHIPQPLLIAIKSEVGLVNKEVHNLTLSDKHRIVNAYRQKVGIRKPENTAGPSQMNPIPNQQRNQQQPSQQGQRAKRSSTSPGEEHEMLPQSDSSPPAAKRMRTSPGMEPTAVPNSGMPMGFPGQAPGGSLPGQPQQGQQGHPPQMNMGLGPTPGQTQVPGQNLVMMRQGPNTHMAPMNGTGPHPQGPHGGIPMNLGMQMAMNPGMAPSNPGQMMGLQQMQAREALYRQSLHSIHKSSMPQPGMANSLVANGGSPAAEYNPGVPGGQFNPGIAQNRMMMNKPMMPPPPPMSGQPKDNGGKDTKNDGSPRNGHPIPGQQMHGAPTTPGPQGQSSQPGQGPMVSSPSSLLTTPNQSQQPPPPSQSTLAPPPQPPQPQVPAPASPVADMSNIFSNDFISNIASSLEVFDSANLFRPDGDINFERDFGQWFNPEDVNGSLDMK